MTKPLPHPLAFLSAASPCRVAPRVCANVQGGEVRYQRRRRHRLRGRRSRLGPRVRFACHAHDGDQKAPRAKCSATFQTRRAHGAGIAPKAGHGFTTNGGDETVTMFDLKTLTVLRQIKVGPGLDGIIRRAR